MTFKGLRKLIQVRNFKWLLNCSKPFFGIIIAITAMNMLSAGVGVASAVLSKQMVDNAVYGYISQAVFYIVLFVAAHLVVLGLGALSAKLSIQLNEKMSYSIEQNVLAHLYKSEWMSYSQFHSGDILTRLTDDISKVTSLWVFTIPNIIAMGIKLVLAFAVLVFYDVLLGLIALVLGPVSIIISFMVGQKLKSLQHEIQTAESRHRSYITELIQHMLIIKTFQYEPSSMAKVIERQNDKYRCVVKRNKLSITANTIMSGGYWLGYVLAFVYGVFKLGRKTATFGIFTAFLQLVGQIQQPFIDLARSIPQMLSGLASVDRLSELEELESEPLIDSDSPDKTDIAGVQLKGVTFGYVPGTDILLDTSLEIEPGEIVALIGSSGEGKTTIMRLLLSLIKARMGRVLISQGNETIPVSSKTRKYFAYVPQGNTLFSGTISENLRVGKPDASTDELECAARAACAWDFINEMPDNLDSVVGEGGIGLSEGQAQRLCLARAFLRSAPILLLDEATSALDMETEKRIFENIRNLTPKKTCIIVTHRLSVLPLCDRVYRLENGKLYKHDTSEFSNLILREKKAD